MNDERGTSGRRERGDLERPPWVTRVGAALAFLSALVLAACSPEPTGQALIAEGEQVYIMNCSRCHQIDGRGFFPVNPNLAGNPIVTLFDPNPTIEVVMHGAGSMPAFHDRLAPDEMAAVISYIRNAWGNSASTVRPTQTR
ncbi:MAG: cytochrome c [Chloroflexota bacterium]